MKSYFVFFLFFFDFIDCSFIGNLEAFEDLSYRKLSENCFGEDVVKLSNLVLATAIHECFLNSSIAGDIDDLEENTIDKITQTIIEASRQGNRNGGNRNGDSGQNGGRQLDRGENRDVGRNRIRQQERDKKLDRNRQRDRNMGRQLKNSRKKNNRNRDKDYDYDYSQEKFERNRNNDRSQNRNIFNDFLEQKNNRNTDIRNNRARVRSRERNRNSFRDPEYKDDTYLFSNDKRNRGSNNRDNFRAKGRNRENEKRNRGRSSVASDDYYDYLDDDYDEEYEDNFFIRDRRSATFRPDLISIADVFRKEIILKDKLTKYECVLRRRLDILRSDTYLEALGRAKELNQELKDDLKDSSERCADYVECLMEIFDDSDIFPQPLRQIYELTRCNQRQARLNCIKNDMRNLLPDGANSNGTIGEIFEDLLEKLMEISSFNGDFESFDIFML